MKKNILVVAAVFLSTNFLYADDNPHQPARIGQTSAYLNPAPKSWSFKEVGLIPVQSGGRIKPFDSFAREIVLYLTGSKKYKGWEPIDLLLSWIVYPAAWSDQPFMQISRPDVRRQLSLDEKRLRFSPKEIFSNPTVAQYVRSQGQTSDIPDPKGAMRVDPRKQEQEKFFSRLGLFEGIVSGRAIQVIPMQDPAQPWDSLMGTSKDGDLVRKAYIDIISAYQAGNESKFIAAAHAARELVTGKISHWTEKDAHLLEAESLYNRTQPFFYAWVLYLIAALLWIFGLNKKNIFRKSAVLASVVAFGMHVFGILIRCYIAGRPPVTNMYESVIWVSFGVILFGGVLFYLQKQAVVFAIACALSTVALIAADAAPAMLDPSINPLVPVLRSNYWLTIHVLTITLGYAAMMLTLGTGNATLYLFLKNPKDVQTKVAALNHLTYRSMQFGVVLLAAGTILGGIWADYSWGRFWGWDPKEVWALIALLCYVAILHGRYAGWVGQFGYAAWSVISFLSVLMAWYGVNFILGVGLHSYGFSSGGMVWVSGYVLLQLAFVVWVALVKKNRKR